MPQLLLTLLLIGIGWYFLIRPLRARQREQAALVAVLAVGDRVITAGGIHGVLTGVDEETVQIEVAPGIELTLARPAIARRLDADPTIDSTDPATDAGVDHHLPGRTGDLAEDNVIQDTQGPTTGDPA